MIQGYKTHEEKSHMLKAETDDFRAIEMSGGRYRLYEGINDFPPYWDELRKLFKAYG